MTAGIGEGGGWAGWRDSMVLVGHGYTGTVRWYVVSDAGVATTRTASLRASGRRVTDDDRRQLDHRAANGPLLLAMRARVTSVAEGPP